MKLPGRINAVRQGSPGGELTIEPVPLPRPGKGEVLVRMHASPLNPSDLALLKGGYMERDYPFTPGLEGSGEVVLSGGGVMAGLRVGKQVACTPNPKGDGTWAEYMVTAATRTIPLPRGISPEQGSMMVVNPLTAIALMKIASEEGHAALVNNAAASALGKMLIRLARRSGLPLINVVRREEQVSSLESLGADVVLNASDPGFGEALKQYSSELNATLLLDAVGGDHSSRLLEAAPHNSHLICYARLSGEPLRIDPRLVMQDGKTISGFLLGRWMDTQSLLSKLKLLRQVRKMLPDVLSSPIRQTLPMDQVDQAIALYNQRMSAGKIILRMNEPLNSTLKNHQE